MDLPLKEAPPFAISMTAWAHIVRSFTPRTEDYDRTLVDLLDTPSIRPKGAVSYQTVADVLGWVDLLVSDSSEEIASRLLLDNAAMAQIDRVAGSAREGKIERAITTKTDEMARQLAEAEAARVDAERARVAEHEARTAAEQQSAAVADDLDQHRVRTELLAERAEAERTEREQAERQRAEAEQKILDDKKKSDDRLAAAQSEHSTEIRELRADLDRQKRIARGVAAGVLLVAALAVAIVPLSAGWVSEGWGWVAVVAGGGAIAFLALWLLLSWKKAAAIAVIVFGAVGLANDLYSVAPKDKKPAAAPSQAGKE